MKLDTPTHELPKVLLYPMKECESFFAKHGVYPNAIVMNPQTADRWENVVEDSALETEVDGFLENGKNYNLSFAFTKSVINNL